MNVISTFHINILYKFLNYLYVFSKTDTSKDSFGLAHDP